MFYIAVIYIAIAGGVMFLFWLKAAYRICAYLYKRSQLYPKISHMEWFGIDGGRLQTEFPELYPHHNACRAASKRCAIVWVVIISVSVCILVLLRIFNNWM